MDTLDRFLIREFINYFFFLLVGLALLFLGIDFLSHFWNSSMPAVRIIALYSYKIPAALQQFVPVACLMATLLVLSNMSRQNEILALYSSGIGNVRLISTFIAVAATISTVSFLTFDSLVPTFAKRQLLLTKGLDPNADNMILYNRGGFWYRSGKLIYNVGHIVPETNTLEVVNVYLLGPNFQLLQKIHAKQARYLNNEWVLEDGIVTAYPQDTHFPVSQNFVSKRGVIPEKPSEFRTLIVEEDTMRLRDLRKYIQRNSSYGLDTTSQQVSYHERVAFVFTPLVFVLLAIPFAIKPLRSNPLAKSIGFCFMSVFLYLLMFRMVLSIGKGGHLPPVVAGWATNIIFVAYSTMNIIKGGHARNS